MNLAARSKDCDRRLVILAPYAAEVPATFRSTALNAELHGAMLSQMQRLRGAVYLQDGAVQPHQLETDGRHTLPVDHRSWHVLSVGQDNQVLACSRYLSHAATTAYDGLEIVRSALAQNRRWGGLLQTAVSNDLQKARSRRIQSVEVGGWALAPEVRCTTEALRVALGTYALAQLLGGCIGITTATHRNGSASILKRIGGTSLRVGSENLPPYFDPQFGCYMEVIRFDSHQPNATFDNFVQQLRADMRNVQIVCAEKERPLAAWSVPFDRPAPRIMPAFQLAFAQGA